jgi:hypothetical protein
VPSNPVLADQVVSRWSTSSCLATGACSRLPSSPLTPDHAITISLYAINQRFVTASAVLRQIGVDLVSEIRKA